MVSRARCGILERTTTKAIRKTIALIGCGKTKSSHAAPAEELYVGPLFQATRRWAERNTDAYFIASAMHRIVDPNTVLEPYDLQLTDLSSDERVWRARQIEQQFRFRWMDFCEFAKGPKGNRVAVNKPRVVLLAGRLYLRGFYDRLLHGFDVYDFEDPLKGKGIGDRLAWLAAQNRVDIDSQLRLFEP